MGIFDWLKKESDNTTPVKIAPRRPKFVDHTENFVVNKPLTKGLYFGEYKGLKLASALAMAPVRVPVFFMGYPIPVVEERYQDIVDLIMDRMSLLIPQVHLMKRRDGTIWLWPKYSAKAGRVVIEVINDDSITDIVKDLDTGEVVKIITNEDIKLSVGYDETVTVNRRRVFEKNRITVTYIPVSGIMPDNLKDRSMINTTGILPVPFSQEADADEIRGHSIYGRVISDFKDYHDIDASRTEKIAKFSPKIIVGIDDIDEFAVNNGFEDGADFFENFSLYGSDILTYRPGKGEKPELLELSSSIEVYTSALKQKFRKIIEGTGIPEIAWGLKTEGNLASVEENMATLLMYVKGDQREVTKSWETVFKAILQLELSATLSGPAPDVKVSWNDLDSASDKTKAEIFSLVADGISKVVDKSALTKDQLYRLWKMNFPKATEQEIEEFTAGLSDMAAFKGYSNASYLEQLEAGGQGGL